MPCRGEEDLHESAADIESRKVAILMHFVLEKKGLPVSASLIEARGKPYGRHYLDDNTKSLCELLSAMTEEEINRIVYNARDPVSRKLADWWEHHQEVDKKRKKEEELRNFEKAFEKMMQETRQSLEVNPEWAAKVMNSSIMSPRCSAHSDRKVVLKDMHSVARCYFCMADEIEQLKHEVEVFRHSLKNK